MIKFYYIYKMCSGVYKITNIINRKIYIGSTSNLDNRKSGHFGKSEHNKYLKRAFKKYGIKNFKWDILELVPRLEGESKLDFKKRLVYDREQYYLDSLLFAQEYIKSNKKDKRFRNISYNIAPIAGSVYGTVVTKETKKKNSKSVIQFDLQGNFISEYYSIKEAIKEVNITGIGQACNGECSQMGGFRWMFKKDYLIGKELSKIASKKKEVLCFDKQMNFIKEYSSLIEAERQTGITSISAACRDQSRTAGKLIWILKENCNKRFLKLVE